MSGLLGHHSGRIGLEESQITLCPGAEREPLVDDRPLVRADPLVLAGEGGPDLDVVGHPGHGGASALVRRFQFRLLVWERQSVGTGHVEAVTGQGHGHASPHFEELTATVDRHRQTRERLILTDTYRYLIRCEAIPNMSAIVQNRCARIWSSKHSNC